MSALVTIPPLTLAKIWGELVEAFHGVNSFGGNVAEIYAYRLMPYSLHVAMRGYDVVQDNRIADEDRARAALAAICDLFAEEYGAAVTVNYGRGFCSTAEWLRYAPRFNHRVYIRVDRRP